MHRLLNSLTLVLTLGTVFTRGTAAEDDPTIAIVTCGDRASVLAVWLEEDSGGLGVYVEEVSSGLRGDAYAQMEVALDAGYDVLVVDVDRIDATEVWDDPPIAHCSAFVSSTRPHNDGLIICYSAFSSATLPHNDGLLLAAVLNTVEAAMASPDGRAFHHHHMHLSFEE